MAISFVVVTLVPAEAWGGAQASALMLAPGLLACLCPHNESKRHGQPRCLFRPTMASHLTIAPTDYLPETGHWTKPLRPCGKLEQVCDDATGQGPCSAYARLVYAGIFSVVSLRAKPDCATLMDDLERWLKPPN